MCKKYNAEKRLGLHHVGLVVGRGGESAPRLASAATSAPCRLQVAGLQTMQGTLQGTPTLYAGHHFYSICKFADLLHATIHKQFTSVLYADCRGMAI